MTAPSWIGTLFAHIPHTLRVVRNCLGALVRRGAAPAPQPEAAAGTTDRRTR
jgi:hypothetical protein